jgi:hypothetical protein
LRSIEKHPVRAVGIAAAAGALVQVELAVGLLLGAGATAMLATRSGPEARRELASRLERLAQNARTRFARLRRSADDAAPREETGRP